MTDTRPQPPARDNTDHTSTTPPRSSRRALFRLIAVLLAVVPFFVLEVALRILGVGEPGRFDDPLVGFSGHSPLFEQVAKADVYRTARSRQLFFGVQEFAKEKPEDGFRIFCLGGSTVRGRPYEPPSAFPAWLNVELTACDPARGYEVVNCGGLSYASYRLRVILSEVLDYKPDLIVITTGHNEFLEDRTYGAIKARSAARAWIEDRANSLRLVTASRQLLGFGGDENRTTLDGDVEARLDEASGYASYHRNDEWRAGVVHHFEASVRAMVQQCRDAGVPVILVDPGCNLRDSPPFKSEHVADLSAEKELDWQRAFENGGRAESVEDALKQYRDAEKIDDRHALLLFRIARCLDQLGRHEEALSYYLKAKEEDICPLRMIDATHKRLRLIAESTQTPLIDARGIIQQRSTDRIPGYDWYMDHVHPSIAGHQVIAREVARVMRKNSWPDGVREWTPEERRREYSEHFAALGPNWLVAGSERVSWLENWARRSRLYDESLPVDARGFLHRGFRTFDFGDRRNGRADFVVALAEDETTGPKLLSFALHLVEQGRIREADSLLAEMSKDLLGGDLAAEVLAARLLIAAELGDNEYFDLNSSAAAKPVNDSGPELTAWKKAMPEAAAKVKETTKPVPSSLRRERQGEESAGQQALQR